MTCCWGRSPWLGPGGSSGEHSAPRSRAPSRPGRPSLDGWRRWVKGL
jgi:hypothetical protein